VLGTLADLQRKRQIPLVKGGEAAAGGPASPLAKLDRRKQNAVSVANWFKFILYKFKWDASIEKSRKRTISHEQTKR
jgi:hypothetical protein